MTFDSGSINFGIVGPATTTGQSITSDIFGSDVRLTATITSDTSGGGFRVTAVKSYLARLVFDNGGGDGSDLPGGKPKPGKPRKTVELEKQVGQSDGRTPLAVSKGQAVVIDVEFIAPARSTDTARTATLEVQGDTSPVKIPISALVAQVSVKMPGISVVQGRTTDVPITVELLAGPPTTVTLSFDPPWPGVDFSLSASSFQVSQGSPGSASLHFAAQRTAAVGAYGLHSYASAYEGTLRTNWSFLFSVTVGAPVLRPSPIDQKYAALGGPSSFLGPPSGSEAFCSDYLGQFRSYQNGVIYWSGTDGNGAFEIHGPILAFLGGDKNPASTCSTYDGIGYPTADVVSLLGVVSTDHFQRGGIYAKPTTGMRIVPEPFFDTYVKLGEAGGPLGFPIGGGSIFFQDFENQGLFAPSGGPVETMSISFRDIPPNIKANAYPKEFVLDKVNKVIDDLVAKYNKTADHQLSMQGGPAFQDPQNPVTDYRVDANGVTRNRQYRIQQNFFVSGGICPDLTISLSFDLLLSLGSSASGATDMNGNTVQWTRQSISVSVTNASANVDKHGNPFVTDSQVQQAQDQTVALATQSTSAFALPSYLNFLSVKVLADGSLLALYEPPQSI